MAAQHAQGDPIAFGPSRRNFFDVVASGATFGVGALPHRSAGEAARFSFDLFDIPTVPSLPRRSPFELAVAQAVVGVPGVSLGQYGTLAIDCRRLDPDEPVVTDLGGPGFTGLRAFLDAASRRPTAAAVKWQLLGPVSLGMALVRAGADADVAFQLASKAVRSHLAHIAQTIAEALPGTAQLAIIDEPALTDLAQPRFPIAPDAASDLVSGAMAAVEHLATVGVHHCGDGDLALLLETGPQVLSIPADESLVESAGYLQRFLAAGGWIAWGAVSTNGPIGIGQQRAWQHLQLLFCKLVQAGVDLDLLRRQCLLTPSCGLGAHGSAAATQVAEALRECSLSMRSDGSAARFVLGA